MADGPGVEAPKKAPAVRISSSNKLTAGVIGGAATGVVVWVGKHKFNVDFTEIAPQLTVLGTALASLLTPD